MKPGQLQAFACIMMFLLYFPSLQAEAQGEGQSETDNCPDGFYGKECKSNCSEHCAGDSNPCHNVDGRCSKGCDPGYQGDQCIQTSASSNVATGTQSEAQGEGQSKTETSVSSNVATGTQSSVSSNVATGTQTMVPAKDGGAICQISIILKVASLGLVLAKATTALTTIHWA